MVAVNRIVMFAGLTVSAFFSVSAPAKAQYIVQTIAGSGVAGSSDGTGSSAQFSGPNGLAIDGAGDMYVVESRLVRKITPAGVVTTIAGVQSGGFMSDGPASSRWLSYPTALVSDASGTVYFWDQGAARFRKLSAGTITTLAPYSIWQATASPMTGMIVNGVARDSAGNTYMADEYCSCIRKITASNVASYYAGTWLGGVGFVNGAGPVARFRKPGGIAVDGSGNVYVTDTGNHVVRKITPTGTVSAFSGSGIAGHVDGPAAVAQFYDPRAIAVAPNGRVFVADSNAGFSFVREIAPNGDVTTIAGGAKGFSNGMAMQAQFGMILGLAVGNGALYVNDFGNLRIRRIYQR